METPFRQQEFAKHDVVTKDDMDTTQANLQWLKENTPRGRFFAEEGKPLDARTVVVSGRVGIPKNKKNNTVTKVVSFGRAFAPGCRPHVTTGIVTDGNREIFCVVSGPQGLPLPQASGFEITIHVPGTFKDKWKINKPFYVCWSAFGYRKDDAYDL